MAGLINVVPAGAQEAPAAPKVPAKLTVTDPVGDGNYINDQGFGGDPLPSVGDQVTEDDISDVGDIIGGWFTADKDSVFAHIQTEVPGPATASIMFRMNSNPNGAEAISCLWFEAFLPGAGNVGEGTAGLRDECETATDVDGELILSEGPEGTGIVTIKVPRGEHPSLKDGTVFKSTDIYSRQNFTALFVGQIDSTKPGIDYELKAESVKKPKPKKNPKPKPKKKAKKLTKKACMKLKGKARKKCLKKLKPKKTKKPARCAAYKAGELGAEAETVVVTDAATEAKPVEVTLALDPGFGQATGLDFLHPQLAAVDEVTTAAQSHTYYNVQVDSKAKDTGLFVSLGSPVPDDNDLYLLHSTGNEAAHAAGFHGGGPEPIFDSNANGGHTGPDAEFLDGIKTTDCGGYTVHAIAANSQGGDTPLQFWLGAPSDYEVPAP
jgi:hypothetical protein